MAESIAEVGGRASALKAAAERRDAESKAGMTTGGTENH
jgi:hypothetical protein